MASAANVVMVIFTLILLIAILASAYIMASMAVGKKYGLGLFSRQIEGTTTQGEPMHQIQYHPWVLGGVGIAVVVGFLGCVITGNVTASESAKEGFMSMFGF